jgi:hypothetical protein
MSKINNGNLGLDIYNSIKSLETEARALYNARQNRFPNFTQNPIVGGSYMVNKGRYVSECGREMFFMDNIEVLVLSVFNGVCLVSFRITPELIHERILTAGTLTFIKR